jgi:hypothetical protein
MWLRIKVIDECSQAPSDLITYHGISDFPTDHVRRTDAGTFADLGYETNSQRPALASACWRGEKRKLPSGTDPTRHFRLKPSARGGPCHDEPLEWHDRHGFAYEHENRAF